jgi:hypothetical protein
MILYKTVRMTRDMLMQIQRVWEVPVLDLVHGGQIVVVEGGDKIVDRSLPSAQVEYERMEAVYRNHRSEGGAPGAPVVATVYGEGPRGLKALGEAIQEGHVAEWPQGYVADLVAGCQVGGSDRS